ncbi:MAG TPA: hypothetical protein ENO14_03865 [Chromatiales bacterium]|nr:hypothetical protein [Chromatiales bacterium]
MSAFSDYLEGEIINATLRGGSYSGGLVHVALFTTDPTDADTGAELSDSAYARQVAGDPASAGFDSPGATSGKTANSSTITFPAIADAQVTVTHWGIYDAATGGNLLYQAPLTNSKTLDPSDVPSFPAGALTVTLA